MPASALVLAARRASGYDNHLIYDLLYVALAERQNALLTNPAGRVCDRA
jgi:predicted nucleic acid-binding protein